MWSVKLSIITMWDTNKLFSLLSPGDHPWIRGQTLTSIIPGVEESREMWNEKPSKITGFSACCFLTPTPDTHTHTHTHTHTVSLSLCLSVSLSLSLQSSELGRDQPERERAEWAAGSVPALTPHLHPLPTLWPYGSGDLREEWAWVWPPCMGLPVCDALLMLSLPLGPSRQ